MQRAWARGVCVFVSKGVVSQVTIYVICSDTPAAAPGGGEVVMQDAGLRRSEG